MVLPTNMDPIRGSLHHLRAWLAASSLSYAGAAKEGFVRAHPILFGSAYELTLRGYERWRTRHGRADTLRTFAGYIAPRHQRWLDSMEPVPAVAPCLIGATSAEPCWARTHRVMDRLAA